jgi:phosphatidylserine/phosphatidylglycerophosphate/cardiolipin synthase-like enzyme
VRARSLLVPLSFAVGLVACPEPQAPAGASPTRVELVETAPVETSLDHADIRDAKDVWPEMIARARTSLDIAQFYASEAEDKHLADSRLTPVIRAVCAAAERGVRVRFLADAKLSKQYQKTLEQLTACKVTVRILDLDSWTKGILHAKYFVVDGHESFVGSQNFDWRSLAHVQEIGARVESSEIAAALTDIFELDFALAGPGGAPSDMYLHKPRGSHTPGATNVALADGGTISLVASPPGLLPDEVASDLPRLVTLLDQAKTEVSIQSLTYSTKLSHGKTPGAPFTVLDDALRRAAGRGVRVRLLVSHWALRSEDGRAALRALSAVPNVEVRVITIPESSVGEIPFARVAHAKTVVADGRTSWVGTSNWEGDYFLSSRNVALVVESPAFTAALARVFEDVWKAPITKPL